MHFLEERGKQRMEKLHDADPAGWARDKHSRVAGSRPDTLSGLLLATIFVRLLP